jgi:hypothetical protein
MAGYDIHFQPVPADEVHGFKVFEFGFKASLKVKGPQSLVNRWVKTLMTPKGSDPLSPDDGTGFSNLVGGNVSEVTTDLADAIDLTIEEANAQVKDQDLEGFFPDDERLEGTELLNSIETADGIEIWVLIRNVAGDRLPIRLVTLSTR